MTYLSFKVRISNQRQKSFINLKNSVESNNLSLKYQRIYKYTIRLQSLENLSLCQRLNYSKFI